MKWIHCRASLIPALLIAVFTAMAPASDLDSLIRTGQGRSARASSRDPDWKNGNHDWREIEPGQTLTLADIKGPGIIRHIWFTINAQDLHYARSCVLRMYWDDAEEAAVETPLGDFFAVGHGLRLEVDSRMVSVTSEGRAYNCYWPMPFRQRARITLTNDSPRYRIPKFYYYIDYEDDAALPPDVLYFHAQYRQEWPVGPGDYLVCRTRGRGHYLGTVLSVQLRTKGWFGEGDDRFYVDGEQEPALHGTGSEDYFCDAWGFREFMRPCYGVVLMEGFDFGDRLTVYRWHAPDPIVFQKSLKFMIEHKGSAYDREGKSRGGHAERPDFFSSVAFWYQAGQAESFARVPPLDQRLVHQTRIELETSADNAQADQPSTSFTVQKGSIYSGGGQLLIQPEDGNSVVRIPFALAEDLKGAGRVTLTTSISSGVWRGYLDDEIIPKLRHTDLYGTYYKPTDFNIGYVELTKGQHELRFECLGKRAASRSWQLGVDALTIEHVTRHFTEARTHP